MSEKFEKWFNKQVENKKFSSSEMYELAKGWAYHGYHIGRDAEVRSLQKENNEMREILLEIGAVTHKSKKLHNWYCKNRGRDDI